MESDDELIKRMRRAYWSRSIPEQSDDDAFRAVLAVVREHDAATVAALREALQDVKALAEFWIGREDTRGKSEEEYRMWVVLGHQSTAMQKARAALAKVERLRMAGRSLLDCPHIAERDMEPAWTESETEKAVAEMRAALEDERDKTEQFFAGRPTGHHGDESSLKWEAER